MRLPSALREPQYRAYAFANLFSLNAMWAQRTVVAWLAWDLTASAGWVGLIAFLNFAPTMISGPLFGALADRVDLKVSALIVQLGMMAVALALLALYAFGWLEIYGLAALSLIWGVVISAHHPTRMALAPRLVPRSALGNSVAISSLNFNFARLIGPVIGGWAIAAIGVGWTLAVVTAMFAPVIAILSTLSPRELEGETAPAASITRAIIDGMRFAFQHRIVRAAMALTGTFALIVRGMLELLPALADGVFARGAAGLGELMAAAGGGALIAASTLASREGPGGERLPIRALIAIFAGFGCAAALALAPTWPLALAATAAAGFCGTMVGVTLQAVVQMNLSDAQRGTVMSLWVMVGIGAAAFGAIIMGALADLIGFAPALIGGSAIGMILSVGLLLRARHGL
ncbi:MAG: MFS transporter [Pseudomonadota bacterium]